MEADLRFVLIVIGAMAIAGLLFHGLWTIRRNAKQTQSLIEEQEAARKRGLVVDNEGFDQFGVSRPVMLNGAEEASENSDETAEPHIEFAAEQSEPQVEDVVVQETVVGDEHVADSDIENGHDPELLNEVDVPDDSEHIEPKIEQEPQFESPVSNPKPRAEPKLYASRDDDQLEMNFGAEHKAEAKAKRARKKAEKKTEPVAVQQDISLEEPAVEDVIIFNIVMPEGQSIPGAGLLPSLLTLGLKFGSMDIFHRHQDSAGNGPVLFSLASMINPGTFDIDKMETFSTRGLSLFMQLPMNGDESQAFSMMHNAATQLASEFGAQLLDGQRSVVTKQTVQHYEEKVREFKRKKLLVV